MDWTSKVERSLISRALHYFRGGDRAARNLSDITSKAQDRCLSTPERLRAVKEGSPSKAGEAEASEKTRGRSVCDHLTACCPHSVRLWIKLVSPFKHGVKSSDRGSRSAKSLDGGARRRGSLRSITTGASLRSPPQQSFRSFCCIISRDGSQKISTPSFLRALLLFILGAFVLVTITTSTFRPYPEVVFPAHDERRAQHSLWNDLCHGGILGLGSFKRKKVGQCPAGMEHFIPCYNLTANSEAGYTAGLEFERHCDVSERKQCLIPSPKNYKTLLKWPERRDRLWPANVQIDAASRKNKNRFVTEKDSLKFRDKDPHLRDNAERYADRVASRLDLESYTEFGKAKIRNVMDIGCGSSSLGALLWSHEVVTICVAPYEEHGGQVQLSLERGLPAITGSLAVLQLPYPSSAFDLIHCANCAVKFHTKSGKPILEVDRLLRPGGYFVWAKPSRGGGKAWEELRNVTVSLCWDIVSPSEREQIVIWQKNPSCFGSLVQGIAPTRLGPCEEGRYEADWSWHQPLRSCITLSPPVRRVSVQNQPAWPFRMHIAAPDTAHAKTGPGRGEVTGESRTSIAAVSEYWSLLTPIIFSDHPRRLGDEDIQPAAGTVRNVMDLNAGIGAFNAALLQTGEAVWVMNVVPTSAPNTLPFIFDRGFLGVNHDWCEAFPTYPRTYDLLHAADLLSQEMTRPGSCGLSSLFLEMDRILRPEGWVILRDDLNLIEDGRVAATQMR